MSEQRPLNVQCFVKKEFQSIFIGENNPKLLYVSEIRPDASTHPRVMHAHEEFVELLLICSGTSEFLIHEKKQRVRPGDLLIYNSGVVHDEISGPNAEIGSIKTYLISTIWSQSPYKVWGKRSTSAPTICRISSSR